MTPALLLLALQAPNGLLPPPAERPFGVGEAFHYTARLGILSLGSASMEVAALDTVRGKATYLFRFSLNAGNALWRSNSKLESWTTVDSLLSLKFRNDNNENGRSRLREYDIFPDSGFYRAHGDPVAYPTAGQPLDEASFVYFVRSLSLEVGKTYSFDRHFRIDKNPIVVKVLKRETMELPDGTKVACLVLNPVVGDRGIFAERGDARLWLTDDNRRIPVQIRSRLPFGTINLKLERMTFASESGRTNGA